MTCRMAIGIMGTRGAKVGSSDEPHTKRPPPRKGSGLTYAAAEQMFLTTGDPSTQVLTCSPPFQLDSMSNSNLLSPIMARKLGVSWKPTHRTLTGSVGKPRPVLGVITDGLSILLNEKGKFSWSKSVHIKLEFLVVDEEYLHQSPLLGTPFLIAAKAALSYEGQDPVMRFQGLKRQGSVRLTFDPFGDACTRVAIARRNTSEELPQPQSEELPVPELIEDFSERQIGIPQGIAASPALSTFEDVESAPNVHLSSAVIRATVEFYTRLPTASPYWEIGRAGSAIA